MNPFLAESSSFSSAISQLDERPVLVVGHCRPDGDCIGSQVALTRVLLALGKDARAVNQDPVPRTLEKFVCDTPFYLAEEAPEGNFQVISVDCADRDRVGAHFLRRFPTIDLNVDHHLSNTRYGIQNFIFPEASATGEILAKFFFDCDYPVDKVTAEALYLGICTDTGQFCYAGTNATVFEICRKLCQSGAKPSEIAHELYQKEKPGRIQLLQRFLASFRLEFDDSVCIGSLKEDDYSDTDTKPEDAENFVDYARSVEGVRIGVFLEERSEKIKGSLRAKEEKYRVDLLAKQLGGGGHACAAGFNLSSSLERFYPALIEEIDRHLQMVEKGVVH